MMPAQLPSHQTRNSEVGPTPVVAIRRNELALAASGYPQLQIILSFDVEDHHLIEAAKGLSIPMDLQAGYRERVGPATRWLLEQLAKRGISATFFILGEIARRDPRLIRAIY